MPVEVGGRKVYLRKGDRSQSVNICDAKNHWGEYEHRIYLFEPCFVTEAEVGSHGSVDGLIQWLLQEKSGTIEPQSPEGEEPEARAVIGADLPEDEWLRQAIFLVEQSIDQLLREFLSVPYAHRVEHSIHARLFAILTGHPHFQQLCTFHGGRVQTQPVHKEWPETIPRPETKRGNFDLAIVPPNALAAASPPEFRKGRVVAPIAIEIGLDYGVTHLADDQDKLLHSGVRHGYLLHLTRVGADDSRVNQIIQNPGGNGAVKAAFARIAGSTRFVKFVNEAQITQWQGFQPATSAAVL